MTDLSKQDSSTTTASGESLSSSTPTTPSSPTRRFFSSSNNNNNKCPSSPNNNNNNNNNRKKKEKKKHHHYKAPRGTWNEMPPSPDIILTNMTPDGPYERIHKLEYQMWGEEGAPALRMEEEKKEEKEKVYLECTGWKLRSGLGKFAVKHAWEERRIVLDGDLLSYYDVGKGRRGSNENGGVVGGGGNESSGSEMSGTDTGVTETTMEALGHLNGDGSASINDGNRNTDMNDQDEEETKNSITTNQEDFADDDSIALNPEINTESSPRGTVTLTPSTTTTTTTTTTSSTDDDDKKEVSIELSNENNSSSSTSNPMSAAAIKNSVKSTVVPSPTPYAIKISIPSKHVSWKFCFQDKQTRSRWYYALCDAAGIDDNDDKQIHNLEPGDHVVRWEMIMLPVLVWPIQIHGIVLEVGRNCVILADFGLTSYGPGGGGGGGRRGDKDDEKKKEKEQHDFGMEAWKKLRPKEKKRLNVMVLTDHDEIKKWNKVNYGRNFFKKKDKGKVISSIKSIFGGKTHSPSKGKFNLEGGPGTLSKEAAASLGIVQEEEGKDGQHDSSRGMDDMNDIEAIASLSFHGGESDKVNPKVPVPDFEPDWFREVADDIDSDDEMEGSSSDLVSKEEATEEGSNPPPVFSLDYMSRDTSIQTRNKKRRRKRRWRGKSKLSAEDDSTSNAAHSKLPKSDPPKIVLARTHFVLEHGDELLPPYHVFHSNSECIAVWCKTGRWSTLQTSVFLHSCSVGNAKSSVAFTLGVAATHVFLAPVVALGGVAAVTAPWIILKKSKEKWEAATMKLTEEFWKRANPEVFVEAIEHWSEIH